MIYQYKRIKINRDKEQGFRLFCGYMKMKYSLIYIEESTIINVKLKLLPEDSCKGISMKTPKYWQHWYPDRQEYWQHWNPDRQDYPNSQDLFDEIYHEIRDSGYYNLVSRIFGGTKYDV